MEWKRVKAELLAAGRVALSGEECRPYISRSTAGPTAGGEGSVFFSAGGRRVRLSVDPAAPLILRHEGGGKAVICGPGCDPLRGMLELPGLHCPRQAYITLSERCIFSCRYCTVPRLHGRVKCPDEVVEKVRGVLDRVDAISITSGVAHSVGREEGQVLDVVRKVAPLGKPVGVSVYPTEQSPDLLHDLGIAEVKWNLEAATPALFARMCPGLDYHLMWRALRRSVELFGEGAVCSNVIVGLGETDGEMARCVTDLAGAGVIPVLRPLSPAAELAGWPRPPADRLLRLLEVHGDALRDAGLDPRKVRTMCTACTGCDLTPGRDT
ncbi:MAG: radical SAM protein [Methanomicrobiales archaeon]|nr:radical SAM protein [Methanomicrobiales archaeon]